MQPLLTDTLATRAALCVRQGMDAAQTRSVQELEACAAGSGALLKHKDVRPSFDITLITRRRARTVTAMDRAQC